ncbi:MAG: GNAT family N-acetyltransferase [Bacteroidales bacterium]|nr:GNAT family N-acetyltransferase [Bacteroidales bacterium]
MQEEFSAALHSDFDSFDIFTKLAIARRDDAVIALALVQLYPETKIVILCDIVVDAPLRGQKIGEAMLGWIETEIKVWGAKFIFLESGKNNHSAHHFFEQAGFKGVSIVIIE